MRANSASNGRLERNSKTKKPDDTIKNTETTHNQEQLDPDLKAKVQQLMDMTNCTQENAIFALHDSGNDLNDAVNLLFESNNDMKCEWQEQKTKSKKKQPQAAPEHDESETQEQTDTFNDGWKENRERSYPRNAPPRLQRGGRRGGRDGGDYSSERRGGGFGSGERGRGRGRGGRGRGGSREGGYRSGGFNNRDRDGSRDTGGDAGAPQIGTWTSEAEANPKTDSWGEMWTGEEDNQWTGDLKGTHVFEATSKPSDTFPTPTEFDPTAAAALATPPQTQTPPSQPISTNLNGGTVQQPSQQQTSLNIDTLFPKQQVETFNPPSVTSHYDNQLASDSIKSAIGMATQSQMDDKKNGPQTVSSQPVIPSSAVAPVGGLPQRQPQRQQRSKLPPPSTKIPTAPVEMPHNAATSMMDQLGVQFGTMDFGSDTGGLSFDAGSSITSGYSSSNAVTGSLQMNQPSQQSSLYTSDNKSSSSGTGVGGPEPIPFPPGVGQQPGGNAVTSQQGQQQSRSPTSHSQQTSQSQPPNNQNTSSSIYGAQQQTAAAGKPAQQSSAQVQSAHSGYSVSGQSQYKQPISSSHTQQQQGGQLSQQQQSQSPSSGSATGDNNQSAFHNTTSNRQPHQSGGGGASSGGFYHNLQDSRSGYQTSASSQPANQYTNSLYSSNEQQNSYYTSGVAVSSAAATSLSGVTSSVQPMSTQQSQSRSTGPSKAPPNLPPPAAQAAAGAAPVMQMPGGSYMIPGLQYYTPNQPFYPAATNLEDMQKYQQMAGTAAGYYDMSQYSMPTSSIAGFPATGSGDGKMTRLDAQSPTVQGAQSNQPSQSQQGPGGQGSQQGSNQSQQYMSLPPGYHPTGYYYPGVMSHYGIFQQMPAVTQNMTMPGTNTAGGVYSGQKSGSSNTAAGSSYYGGNNSTGYDDSMSGHSSSDYNKYNSANKQTSNLTGGSANTNSADLNSMYKSAGTNSQANAAMYGAGAPYMTTHAAHMMPGQQHLIQSQIGQAQDTNVGGRGSQSGMGKSHNKQNYYSSGWSN